MMNDKVKVITSSLERCNTASVKEKYSSMIADIMDTIKSIYDQLDTVKVS